MEPSYLSLSQKQWEERVEKSWQLLNPCHVCPRECKIDRTNPQASLGICGMKENPVISSAYPHLWEERCISGTRGSGIIFFTSCNMRCVYCQNYDISQLRIGQEVSIEKLAKIMLSLQNQGCHNINFCTPSIWIPQIIKAVSIAARQGLKLPLVYNTSSYDRVETLRLLEGIVDVYMPDLRYSDNEMGKRYSGVPNYWDVAQKAFKEMHRQVGDLIIKDGIAQRGLLVRHLVLPNNIDGSKKAMEFLAKEISKDTYVNIMDQYWPAHKASNFPELSRRITGEEFEEAVQAARAAGLHRFD